MLDGGDEGESLEYRESEREERGGGTVCVLGRWGSEKAGVVN